MDDGQSDILMIEDEDAMSVSLNIVSLICHTIALNILSNI